MSYCGAGYCPTIAMNSNKTTTKEEVKKEIKVNTIAANNNYKKCSSFPHKNAAIKRRCPQMLGASSLCFIQNLREKKSLDATVRSFVSMQQYNRE